MPSVKLALLIAILALDGYLATHAIAADPPLTGPQTEKRFPPLKVPEGFKATLFACDPLIEYPSVIAAGPRPGAIFVAIDYMTGLGTEIVRRDEIRLVEDTDGDGYADKATVFAKGFNSIMGLAWHDGTVYVMHAPFLTAVRDTKGTGAADERKDLLTGLGLTPEENPVRLHCANGVTVGHDGWLYLALGDHGCNVPRPEGDRLVLEGGGILRCRPDGRDLHLFSSGLRNIYDVALDAELNVFVRDNENDGGTYKIRVCHSFHGADHGYPYLYEERPDEALAPLADLGLGSSAGVACYLERQFPAEYRGNLFACEWGRSVVRYPLVREGSRFAKRQEIELAAGAADDPYGFKPTDVVVQRDGSIAVSDWADGQRPLRGRGRIYTLTFAGERGKEPPQRDSVGNALRGVLELLVKLDSESYYERCDAQLALERLGADGLKAVTDALSEKRLQVLGRLHAIWILAHVGKRDSIDQLLRLAESDAEPSVRAQAVRAVADLTDPVLVQHRVNAGRGDERIAARLAALGKNQDPHVVLEVVVALGRLRWSESPGWLRENLKELDPTLSHAAMQTMRRSANWPAVLKLVDAPDSEPLRAIALRAISGQYDSALIDGIFVLTRPELRPDRLREYADVLARVYKKPGPWSYWGYRPAPRPANTETWGRSFEISRELNLLLTDPDRAARLSVLRLMQREKVPVSMPTLGNWLVDERDAERVAAILVSLSDHTAEEIRPLVTTIVSDAKQSQANRLAALALFVRGFDATAPAQLLALIDSIEDGPVMAEVLRRAGAYRNSDMATMLVSKLKSPEPAVRAAAIEALGQSGAAEGVEPLVALLADSNANVRRAAASAAGKLNARQAVEPLLKLAVDADPLVRRASFESLRLLREPRAVPLAVAALADRQTELAALEFLGELGGPTQAEAIADLAKRSPSVEISSAVMRILSGWRERKKITAQEQQDCERAIAEIHGASGVLVLWKLVGPVLPTEAARLGERYSSGETAIDSVQWTSFIAAGAEARVIASLKDAIPEGACLAYAELAVSEAASVEFLASSGGSLQVWLNGKSLYQRDEPRGYRPDSDRFSADLLKGTNRLLVAAGPSKDAKDAAEFHVRFRRKSALAEHERLTLAALSRPGSAERGKAVFQNVEKSHCLKCHRLGEQGERIGPELSGLGNRFSRIYMVESILEPGRAIAPSFVTHTAVLTDGTVVSGIKLEETATTLTLADNQGKKQVLSKTEIEMQRLSPLSTMPEGLEKRLSEEEFVDLIAFLASLKNN